MLEIGGRNVTSVTRSCELHVDKIRVRSRNLNYLKVGTSLYSPCVTRLDVTGVDDTESLNNLRIDHKT